MEFELLENDVLESLEDLGYVSGAGGAGPSRCGPGAEGGSGTDTAPLSAPHRRGRPAPEGRGSGQRLERTLLVRAAPRVGLVMVPQGSWAGFQLQALASESLLRAS